jgi:hypothetical protein
MEYPSISMKGAPNGPLSSAFKKIIGARQNACHITYNQHPYWSPIIGYRLRGLHNLASHNIMGYQTISISDTPNEPLSSAFKAHVAPMPNFSLQDAIPTTNYSSHNITSPSWTTNIKNTHTSKHQPRILKTHNPCNTTHLLKSRRRKKKQKPWVVASYQKPQSAQKHTNLK